MSDRDKPKYSLKRQLGNLAEDLAAMFLVKQGYKILARNFLKPWGELDIISLKAGIVRFIEVKSMFSRETWEDLVSRNVSRISFTVDSFRVEFSHETEDDGIDYRPEEAVHLWKQKRMMRAVQTFLIESPRYEDLEWQIDVISLKLDFPAKKAIIRHIENVVFEV